MDGIPDDDFKVSSVFSQSLFMIPKYQREYSWGTNHVSDFMNDIEFVIEREENDSDVEHYFGTFVLEERETVDSHDYLQFEKYSVVDGQQRLTTLTILVRSLIEELHWISEKDIPDQMSEDIEETVENWRKAYIIKEGHHKLELGNISNSTYEELIIEGQDPEKIDDKPHSAGKKLIEAKKEIRNHIKSWRRDFETEEDFDYGEYYKFLQSVYKTATHKFKVTIKSVEDMDEAARMFKVINNRGKELTLLDKVKSHVVYAASRTENLDSEKLYNEFGEIVRNVTKYDGCGDQELDNLVRAHWIAFSGEPSHERSKRKGPSEIHKRIAELENYAHIDRENLDKWIQMYVESLKTASEYYVPLTKPEEFKEEYDGESDILKVARDRIQGVNIYGQAERSFAPLLISVATRFGVESEEFVDILDLSDSLIFRYNLVMSRGPNTYKNTIASVSYDLYWSEAEKSQIEMIFNSKSERYIGYDSRSKGIRKIKERINKKIEEKCPDSVFKEHLKNRDIIDGEYTNGWGGIRNKDAIKYLLYEYERYLRKGSDSDLRNLNSFSEWRDNFEVEHLVPKNAEAGHKLNPHDKNRNRLGNLALIADTDNKENGRDPFEQKYEDMYQNSTIKMLNELDGPKWEVSDVDTRTDKIADLALKRWNTDWRKFEEY